MNPDTLTPFSQEELEEEQRNRMAQIAEKLKEQAEWRYNTWRQRPEVKESGLDWRPFQDRDLDTFYCRLLENGLRVKQQDVKAMIFSRDFCPDYDELATEIYNLHNELRTNPLSFVSKLKESLKHFREKIYHKP